MDFIASKIFWLLARPSSLILIALIIAGILWLLGRIRASGGFRRAARVLATTAMGAIVLVSIVPVGGWLLTYLENRHPPPDQWPEQVDGIILLGGAVAPYLSEARGQIVTNAAAERYLHFAELARRHPEARLVFTGGSGDPLNPDLKEAASMPEFMRILGLSSRSVLLEDQSRNTYENAVYSKSLVEPNPGETWLLVTSAWHMPRSVRVFESESWSVTPAPTDYRTSGTYEPFLMFNPSRGLSMLDLATREFIGMAAYWALGRIDRPYP